MIDRLPNTDTFPAKQLQQLVGKSLNAAQIFSLLTKAPMFWEKQAERCGDETTVGKVGNRRIQTLQMAKKKTSRWRAHSSARNL